MKSLLYSIIPREIFVTAGLFCFYGALFAAAMFIPIFCLGSLITLFP